MLKAEMKALYAGCDLNDPAGRLVLADFMKESNRPVYEKMLRSDESLVWDNLSLTTVPKYLDRLIKRLVKLRPPKNPLRNKGYVRKCYQKVRSGLWGRLWNIIPDNHKDVVGVGCRGGYACHDIVVSPEAYDIIDKIIAFHNDDIKDALSRHAQRNRQTSSIVEGDHRPQPMY